MGNYYLTTTQGISGAISEADALDFGTSDFSLCAWVKRNLGATAIQVALVVSYIGCIRSGTDASLGFLYGGGVNKIRFQFSVTADPPLIQIFGDTVIDDGDWYFVVVTCERNSATGLRLYINGVEDATPVDPTRYSSNSFLWDNVYLPTAGGGPEFSIDQFRYYSFVLTPEQITEIYATGSGAEIDEDEIQNFIHDEFDDEAGFVGIEFNEGEGTDFTGRHYAGGQWSDLDGTLSGNFTWASGGVPFDVIAVDPITRHCGDGYRRAKSIRTRKIEELVFPKQRQIINPSYAKQMALFHKTLKSPQVAPKYPTIQIMKRVFRTNND